MKHTSYFSNVLFVVQAVDDGARAEKEHRLEEGVCADVKEGKLGLI